MIVTYRSDLADDVLAGEMDFAEALDKAHERRVAKITKKEKLERIEKPRPGQAGRAGRRNAPPRTDDDPNLPRRIEPRRTPPPETLASSALCVLEVARGFSSR
jgi:hypothetical protein